jgi:UDPglucose--hexose-1-phosphate uridylyltransferase
MTVSVLPQFRTDILTGLQVLVAPVRSSRPSAVHPEPALLATDDPFAEGNEHETPGERFAIRIHGSLKNSPGWQLRIVPNRFPAVADLVPDQANAPSSPGNPLFPAQPAWGEHDVVIECPDSRSRLAELSLDEVQTVLHAWRWRVQQLAATKRFSTLAVFRNEGFSAGASLAHCHSQIIASEQLCSLDAERHAYAERYRQSTGRELILDLLNAERQDGRRMICETSEFAVLCPYAPRTSWHVRFIPLSEAGLSFAEASDAALTQLAALLKQMLTTLKTAIGCEFSFNLTLPHPRIDTEPEFRWMLDLLPRTGRSAGWEFLTGTEIVTVSPEHCANALRSLRVAE